MNRQRGTGWTEVRALLRRGPDHYLIAKATSDPDAPWEFPGERLKPHEAAEHVLRRLCQTRLGINPGVLSPQPPFTHGFGTHAVSFRYYVCPLSSDEATPLGYAEVRWVAARQLRDYGFDAGSQPVVDQLVDGAQDR